MDNSIDSKDILENIIANNGSCDWVKDNEICSRCPIRNGMIDEEGNSISCFEAVHKNKCERYTIKEEQDRLYRDAALDKLTDMIIEENFCGESNKDE